MNHAPTEIFCLVPVVLWKIFVHWPSSQPPKSYLRNHNHRLVIMLRGHISGQTKLAVQSQRAALRFALRSPVLLKSPIAQQSMTYATKKSFSRKTSSGTEEKRRTTPAKKKDPFIYSFAHTAAYSNFHKKAPELSEELPGKATFDLPTIFPEGSSANFAGSNVYQYSSKATRALTHLGSFKPDQKNELFRERATLLRDSSSVQIFDILSNSASSPSSQNRFCITGAKGTGKSTALAQAHAFAVEQGYVVIHIPRAIDLLSGRFDAVLAKDASQITNSREFNQPMYVQKLMRKIAKANESILKTISPSKEYKFETSRSSKPLKFTPSDSLYSMLTIGKSHSEKCEIFNTVLDELAAQTQAPVLFTLDGFNAFSHHQYSANRDVDNKQIYHGELQIPRAFLDFFSGARVFKNGAVIAGLSSYKNGYTIPHGLGQAEPYAYAKPEDYDPVLANQMLANGGVKALDIEPLTLTETETLLKYYSNGRVIHQPITESFVQQKYFLSGNGNPAALIKSCVEVY